MAAISVHQTEGDEDLLQVGRQGRTQLHGGQLQASLRTWFEGRAKGRVVVQLEDVRKKRSTYIP